MVDLAPLIVTAQRLITENGRSVTFVRHNQTVGVAANPWDGPAVDARAAPDSTLVVDAVFVQPDSTRQLGLSNEQSDLVMKSDQIMIVSQGENDLSVFQEVLDGGIYWKIKVIETLKPGAVTALAFVGVAR